MQKNLEAKIEKQFGNKIWLQMNQKIIERNLISSAFAYSLIKFVFLSVALVFLLKLGWMARSYAVTFLISGALTLILAQFAFLGHDAGHLAIHSEIPVNRIFGQLCMTLVAGLAFDEWSRRHRCHHQNCQNESLDPDMDVDIVVSLTANSLQKKSTIGKIFSKYQVYLMPMLSLFFGHSQRHLSQIAVLKSPAKYALDLMVLILHYLLWFVIPYFFFQVPIAQICIIYFLPIFILGPYFASTFWVNHIGMPLVKSQSEFSFVEHQVLTSRNISSPGWLNWFFGGLNFQIEHHLFPKIPSHQLRKMTSVVRDQLSQIGLPYCEVRWTEAVVAIFKHLRQVSKQ